MIWRLFFGVLGPGVAPACFSTLLSTLPIIPQNLNCQGDTFSSLPRLYLIYKYNLIVAYIWYIKHILPVLFRI